MKNFKLLLSLAIVAFIFQACNDDETAKSADVEGQWNVTDIAFEFTVNGESLSTFFGQDQADAFEEILKEPLEESFAGISIQFNGDGTYESTESGGTTESGTWSLNSDGTIMTFDGGSAEEVAFDVKASTNDTLILAFSDTDNSTDYDQDGSNDEFTSTFELTLTK